jgi:hypothetical protein
MAGLPHYSIVPCCSNKGQQETFFLIPLGVIKNIENGVHEYTGSEVTLNGVTFTPGYCYNIIFQGSAFEFYPSSPVSDTFTKLENNNCDNLECAPCVPCFELTSCNGTSQNIIISNSQELYNHYVNNNIVTLLGYEGCWEINTHEDCECAVSVTVLTSHPSCQECLPIVNYKFTSCDNQSIIRYSTDDYSAYVGKTVELECGGCWFVSEIDFVPPSTQTIDILYTFDSCSACAKSYYKLTNCTDDTQVIYTDSVLNLQLPQISTFNANPDPNPVPTNCNCIKVTYELQQTNCDCISVTYKLIGEEPVTVEVGSSEDGNYYIEIESETYRVEKYGSEWIVTDGGTQMFVAVASSGTGNRVMTSENGIDWTIQTSSANNQWKSIVYGNGKFVAVSNSGANRVMYSDNGTTWISASASENNEWNSVTFGNGKFVAVSSNGTNRVMYSTDGITWISATASENNVWNSVTFGNGLFVAVSTDGTNRVMISSDGVSWTSYTASQNNTWRSVTYGNGLFVAVSQDGTNRVMTSPDGEIWTNRTQSENNFWTAITYGNGLFVAVAYLSGTNRVMTSANGITWTSQSASENLNWISVTYGNGLFVAVAYDGTNRVTTSPNGTNWTSRSDAGDNEWQSVTFGGAEIYATLSNDTPCPFGTYTLSEGSIFESFSVEPCEPNEPVTVEVQEEDGSFTFDGYELSCNGGVWSVVGENPSGCTNEFARVTYTFEGDEYTVDIPRVGELNGESEYIGFGNALANNGSEWELITQHGEAFSDDLEIWTSESLSDISIEFVTIPNECLKVIIDGVEYNLQYSGIVNSKKSYFYTLDIGLILSVGVNWQGSNWLMLINHSVLGIISYTLPSPLDPPISTEWIGEGLENVSTTACDCATTDPLATLTASCGCAVGQYTIPNDSIFTSFVVELCSVPSNTVISIQECPGCFIVEPTRTPVNPVKVTLVEVFTDCLDCLPAPPQPVVISQPKRKIKPGYSTPTCDIRTYEKITCKSSEILYKQVLQLRYGISNCCPEEDEKWLIKKELIDLVSLIDPNYICKPSTSCCNQPINDCGCNTLKTCNSQ